MKAADEGSPGTTISSSSSSSTWETVMVRPSRSNGTRERRRMRSVWSRLCLVSVIVVLPAASIPAISTQDLTWALATGSSYSMPCRSAPRTLSGVKRPSRASIPAPISASGSTTRSTGRRRIDSSPSRVHSPPGCPASHPGSSRSSVPRVAHVEAPAGGLQRGVQAHAADDQLAGAPPRCPRRS